MCQLGCSASAALVHNFAAPPIRCKFCVEDSNMPKYFRQLLMVFAFVAVSATFWWQTTASASAGTSSWADRGAPFHFNARTDLAPRNAPLVRSAPWMPAIKGAQIERVFMQPNSDWGAGHRGIDLVAKAGAELTSPTEARIKFAGLVFGRPVITLLTPDNLVLEFEPACLKPPSSVGDHLEEGDVFATFCSAELSTHCNDPCLHWGVRAGEGYLSAQRFLFELRPSRVKPSDERSGSQT